MSKWRIHWNDERVSDWMDTDTLYNVIWGEEASVLYIEAEHLKAHIDKVLVLMKEGVCAVGQWGEVLSYREGAYHVDSARVPEWEIRAALQVRYTVDPEDYIEDKAYIEEKLSVAAGSPN